MFFVYFLIELLEYKNVFRFEKSKLLTGKASPIIGGCFGIIPQCGFSVISAELYAERKMSISALIAVFLATSDEAFPILLSNYKSIPVLLLLLVVKFLIAIIVGYIVMVISRRFLKSANIAKHTNKNTAETENHEHNHNDENHNHDEHEHHNHDEHEHEEDEHHDEHNENHEHKKEKHIHACCHHDIEDNQSFNWKHPLVHCVKIIAYIFIVNLCVSILFEAIGEDNVEKFLTSSSILQPVIALVIGFIPNCASSVIITELYMQDMLSFGSILTGLCANAGIGLFVLFKNNKNLKENIFIVATIIITSLVFGYIFHFIPLGI